MRILICGDTHGDKPDILILCKIAVNKKCSHIMICGDFGIWEHLEQEKGFIDYVSKLAIEYNLIINFIKGNHENHELLNIWAHDDVFPVEIKPNLWYYPNRCLFEWDDVRVYVMGGAYSTDKENRTIGLSWWPDEEISMKDVYLSSEVGHVDILLSHDMPESSNLYSLNGTLSKSSQLIFNENSRYYKQDLYSQSHRRKLQEVIERVHPKLLFHGHFHVRYDGRGHYAKTNGDKEYFPIIGLSYNENWLEQSIIFDTSAYKRNLKCLE
ncbi:MAG: metallophosphoesterase [Candidatus Omnitrophica bacterium]|jgi:predicted phosphodiesterase|nr:metallophosphoesterase [Candidatus Omnitrophota bacterium]